MKNKYFFFLLKSLFQQFEICCVFIFFKVKGIKQNFDILSGIRQMHIINDYKFLKKLNSNQENLFITGTK
jgi:hypothetical protein